MSGLHKRRASRKIVDGLAPEDIRVQRSSATSRRGRAAGMRPHVMLSLLVIVAACTGGCGESADREREAPGAAPAPRVAPPPAGTHAVFTDATTGAFLDTLEARTFRFFWERSDEHTGLTPDRWPTRSFASVSATGFALTAYPIGIERGYVSRAAARDRVLKTLRFFWTAPQDSSRTGVIGYKGFFYHFLHLHDGTRFENVELSTVDTALFLAGALFCQSYFDSADPAEAEIRALADSLYARADWQWAQTRPPAIGHGWDPEGGALPYDWRGYSEAMIVYLMALGSQSHPVDASAWTEWTSGYRWGEFEGQEHLGFAPLFGHQYSHVWIDFRGVQDAYMRGKGIDYFENSRRATLAQYAYAVRNPGGFTGYGPGLWGLSACDGPMDQKIIIEGRERQFRTYAARGASFNEVQDDGTIAPTAAGGSIAFAPELVVPALVSMRDTYGDKIFGRYGFLDALNPTLRASPHLQHGRIDSQLGWFDTDYLGIDQGPIIAMIENLRSDLVWRTMRKNAHLVRGLRAAGFTGGWLDAPAAPAGQGMGSTAPAARRDGRETLRFWAMGREGEVVQELVRDFEALHPGVRVQVQQIPWSAAHEKLLTAHVGRSSPDLAQLGNTWVSEFSALRALEPLDAYIDASAVVDSASYFPGIWDTNRIGPHVYGIPWYVDTRVMFYRKDLLAQAGFDSMPSTWDGWRRAMVAVKAIVGPDRYPMFLPLNEWPPPAILGLQAGSPLLSGNATHGAFSGPEFRRAFAFYTGLYRDRLAPPITGNEISNLYQEFERGYISMYISGPWNVGEFRRRLPPAMQDAWATAPLPGPDGPGVSLAGGSSLVLFARSKYKRTAWELVEYLSQPEQQSRFRVLTGDLPARVEAWRDSALALDPHMRSFGAQLERVVSTPKLPEWELIATRLLERVELAVRGGVPPDSALALLDRDVERILEKRRWMLARAAAASHAAPAAAAAGPGARR